MINFSSSFKLSVIGYLPHPKLSKHHINDIIIWSNQTESRLTSVNKFFIVKLIFRGGKKFEGVL